MKTVKTAACGFLTCLSHALDKSFNRHLLQLLTLMTAWAGYAQVNVSLQTTPAGPQIAVNGQTIAARMFWGKPGFGQAAAETGWKEHSFEFTTLFDARGTLHFRFGASAGEVQLADVRLTALDNGQEVLDEGSFSTAEAFAGQWNIWPPDERNTVGQVQIADSAVILRLSDPPDGIWPDFHLWSSVRQLRPQTTYRCSFKVRAAPARMITPAVYHANNGWTAIGGPPGPFLSELALARDAGVNLISFGIVSSWVPPDQEPDWRHIEAVVQPIIEMHPGALLIPRINLDAPAWWIARHPDALMVFDDGTAGSKVSVSHRQYRADAAAHLERVCAWLSARFPDHFAGIHPCGQNTGEWFYEGSWGAGLSGYDPATLQAWQAYAAGGGPVPDASRRRSASQSRLLNPASQGDVIGFNRFLQDEMADFILTLAEAARRSTGGRKLVFFFYGYHYEFGTAVNSPAVSGHYSLARVLQSEDIDVLCGPLSYRDRGLAGTGPVMSSAESVARAGKLWFNEDDTRTYLNTNTADHARYGGLADQAQTRSVLLRNTAQASIRGLGTWWMDHGAFTAGGWFDDPELWQVMTELQPLDALMRSRPAPFSPEIAAVIHETSILHLAGGSYTIGRSLIADSRNALGRCGAPYGQYLLKDVLEGNVSAKLQIFLAAWALSDQEQLQLAASRVPGTTRVWCYAPGFLHPEGYSIDAMQSVTGFRHRRTSPGTAVVKPTAAGEDLGLLRAWGPREKIQPLFSADAEPHEVLAVYATGAPAVAVREHREGIDVFVGTPQLTPELVRALARIAGVHLYTDKDAGVWASNNHMSIHAVNDSSLLVDIGEEVPVIDALTDAWTGDGPVFALNLPAGGTQVLKWNSSPMSVSPVPPRHYALRQNYPNPFNSRTTFNFSLPEDGLVSLVLYDIRGREVERLIDARMTAGSHTLMWDAGPLDSGVYICLLRAGGRAQRRKIVLIR